MTARTIHRFSKVKGINTTLEVHRDEVGWVFAIRFDDQGLVFNLDPEDEPFLVALLTNDEVKTAPRLDVTPGPLYLTESKEIRLFDRFYNSDHDTGWQVIGWSPSGAHLRRWVDNYTCETQVVPLGELSRSPWQHLPKPDGDTDPREIEE